MEEEEAVSFFDKPAKEWTVKDHLKVNALTVVVTTVVGAVTTSALLVVQAKRKARKDKKMLENQRASITPIPQTD